jgi:hypothetical protein
LGGWSAERQDRTVDTAIFSRVLYQLSYLGMRADFTIGGGSVKKMNRSRIFLDEIISINDEVISGYHPKPDFPLTIYPREAKMVMSYNCMDWIMR